MPLTDEEWRASINEYNGAMSDVETDLGTALEGIGSALQGLADRGAIPRAEARSLNETLREYLFRAEDRVNALSRRLGEMRRAAEL